MFTIGLRNTLIELHYLLLSKFPWLNTSERTLLFFFFFFRRTAHFHRNPTPRAAGPCGKPRLAKLLSQRQPSSEHHVVKGRRHRAKCQSKGTNCFNNYFNKKWNKWVVLLFAWLVGWAGSYLNGHIY